MLDDPEIAGALGVFSRADLRRIWSDATYESMLDERLQLIVRFRLCFQVPGSDTYIAPQLLTPSQPAYHWDESGNLTLTYEYEVMPKGVARRLIVALHDLIAPRGFLSGGTAPYSNTTPAEPRSSRCTGGGCSRSGSGAAIRACC